GKISRLPSPKAEPTLPVTKGYPGPSVEKTVTLGKDSIRFAPDKSPGHQSVIPSGGSKHEFDRTNVSVATELVAVPSPLLTTTEYVPAFAAFSFSISRLAVPALITGSATLFEVQR